MTIRTDPQEDLVTDAEQAAAYRDAVFSLQSVTNLPLSTTIGYLIRSGYLVPCEAARFTVEVHGDEDGTDQREARVVDAVRVDGKTHLVVIADV